MNDRKAFERAIRLNPQDEAPRLIYADWLEEHGYDEWADLMRRGADGHLICSLDEYNLHALKFDLTLFLCVAVTVTTSLAKSKTMQRNMQANSSAVTV